MTTEAATIVDRLTVAATAAIRDQRPTLTYKPEQVRGLVVDLEIGRTGALESTVYVERTTRPTRGQRAG